MEFKHKHTNKELKDYKERAQMPAVFKYIRKHKLSKGDYRLRFMMVLGNASLETGRIAQHGAAICYKQA